MTAVLRTIKQSWNQGRTLLTFGFLQAGGQVLGMAAPLVIAKFSSEALFGRYSLAKMIIFFFTSTLIASTQSPFVVHANQERDKTGKISRSFTVQCLFFVAGLAAFAAITTIFSHSLTAFADISVGDLLFASAAFLALAVKAFLANLFMALGQRVRSALVESVFGVLVLATVVFVCVAGRLSLAWAFLAYCLAGLGATVLFLGAVNFRAILPLHWDRKHCAEMFDFTKWIVAGAAATYFINWGDNLVLRPYVSMANIGTYNLAYQIFKGVIMLTFALFAYFLPFISQHIENRAMIRDYLFRKRPRIFLAGLAGIGVLFLVAPAAFRAVYGSAYPGSLTALRVLLIGSAFMLYAIFYAPILNALKLYRFAQTVNIIQVTLNILLDLILVPRMGMMGAAVATSIAYFCHAAILETHYRIRLKPMLTL
jgi:O-antigen/teichoic acid export membrane protein